jgi:hypothetical protein
MSAPRVYPVIRTAFAVRDADTDADGGSDLPVDRRVGVG